MTPIGCRSTQPSIGTLGLVEGWLVHEFATSRLVERSSRLADPVMWRHAKPDSVKLRNRGATSSGGSTSTGACPGTGGPSMVELPLGYCIDSTEVTTGQYQAWLDTNPSTTDQTSVCAWNGSFGPGCIWPPIRPDIPVTCLDWCDAYAYCAAVGKRLCGRIGGGAAATGDYANAALSQWYAACSSDGVNTYPYGSSYSGTACNGADAGNNNVFTAAGSMPLCQSSVAGYTGIFDMTGNAWEWIDSCDGTGGPENGCRAVGGAVNTETTGGLACGTNASSHYRRPIRKAPSPHACSAYGVGRTRRHTCRLGPG